MPSPSRPAGGRLRILHVFRAPVGGLFRHVLDLARGQAERGHDVGLVCDASTGGERAQAALDALRPALSLGVARRPMRRNPHGSDLSVLLDLRRHCAALRPDVLHGHGSKGGAYARLVGGSGGAGAIRIYTPHGGSFNFQPGTPLHKLYMGIERVLARRTDLLLFESEYIAARFRSFCGETGALIRVVPNGIADAEFEPLERGPDPFDLVYVGELRFVKGVDTLLDAVALVRRERSTRLTLLVVGSGPNERELHDLAKGKGVWDSVAFVPPQPIRGAIARGRVMVVPSLAESLPYVVLEAAAAAQPLIATNVGGIPEIFGPLSGELIAPRDPRVLAEAIVAKLGAPEEERADVARRLREHVRSRFSLDRMVDGVIAGYETALARKAGRVDDSLKASLTVPL